MNPFFWSFSLYAQGSPPTGPVPTGGPSPWGSLLMLLLLFVIFYFLLIRPQQKQMKEHQKLIQSLEKGDEVVTQSGIHGKIVALSERTAILEVSKGVEMKFDRSTIARKKPKEE